MFGIFRYLLSVLVVHGHLVWSLSGHTNWVGFYSVHAFFVLSGFLMTRVLHESYGYSTAGMVQFLSNRALRIFPPYWVAILISAVVLLADPDNGAFRAIFFLPPDASSWARNVLIFGMALHHPALVGPAWSLHFEWIYYLLMAFGASRNKRLTLAWLAFGILWTAWALASGFSWGTRYATEISASLPFALGATMYFYRRAFPRWTALVPVAFFLHAFAAAALWTDIAAEGFYASLLLATGSVLVLADWRPTGRLAIWDQRLGDLSYPIFLLHFPVAYAVVSLDPTILQDPTKWFVATIVAVQLPSILLQRLVESPMERLRGRIRVLAKRRQAATVIAGNGDQSVVDYRTPAWLSALPLAAVVLLHLGTYKVLAYKLPNDDAELLAGVALGFLGVGVVLSVPMGSSFSEASREFAERMGVTAGVSVCVAFFVLTLTLVAPARLRHLAPGLLPYIGVAATTFAAFLVVGMAAGATLLSTNVRLRTSITFLSLGGAIATPIAVWILPVVGAPGLVFLATVLLILPTAWNPQRKGRVLAAIAWMSVLIVIPSTQPAVRPSPSKAMSTPLEIPSATEFTAWGAYQRIDAIRALVNVNRLFIRSDGEARGTIPLLSPEERLPILASPPSARLPYLITQPQSDVLVLGATAATELAAAMGAGAANVTTVDAEPVSREMILGPLLPLTGGIARRDGVSIITDNPRAWLETTTERFDVIRLTDLTSGGRPSPFLAAHLDSGSFLLTVEGLSTCLERLKPDGILATTFAGTETGPNAKLARAVLEDVRRAMDEGVAFNLGAHVAIVGIRQPAPSIDILVAKAPLTTAAINRIRAVVDSIPGTDVVHTPDAPVAAGPLAALLQPPNTAVPWETRANEWARDESPYQFDARQVAAAIGLAAPIADAAPGNATTARFLVAQAVISVLLALGATLAILVLGRTRQNGILNPPVGLAETSIAGLGAALAASASIHTITLARGSLVEAWTFAMITLPLLGALLLLLLERSRPVQEVDGEEDDSAATPFVLRYGLFLCWLAAGSSLSPLIAIGSDFPTMRWLAGGCLLAAALLYTVRQRTGWSKA